MEAFPIIVMIVLAVVVTPIALILHKKSAQAWERAAGVLGLTFTPGSWTRPRTISGSIDGFEILVRTITKGGGKNRRIFTRIDVTGSGSIPRSLSLSAEGLWSSVKRTFGAGDIEIGDDAFDSRIVVQGDKLRVFALLDQRTRDLLLQRVGALRLKIQNGRVRFDKRGVMSDAAKIADTVSQILEVARALSLDDRSIAARLHYNATTDSNANVRRESLMFLVGSYATSTEARAAVERCRKDSDAQIRLLAASHSGEEGWEPLFELIRWPEQADSIRIEALSALAKQFPKDRVAEVLARLFDDPSIEVRRAAIAEVGRLRIHELSDAIADLAAEADDETTAHIARSLGALGVDSREQTLIDLLARESDSVRKAAAWALGHVGSVRAVEPLLAFTKGLLTDGELKSAAREAIADIQIRLGDADGGRLSLAEAGAEEGGLSLAHEAGSVSVVKDREEESA